MLEESRLIARTFLQAAFDGESHGIRSYAQMFMASLVVSSACGLADDAVSPLQMSYAILAKDGCNTP